MILSAATAGHLLALLLAFGSFSLAHRVLTLFPTEDHAPLQLALPLGAVSVTAGHLLEDSVPPVITAFCTALALSTLIGVLLESSPRDGGVEYPR